MNNKSATLLIGYYVISLIMTWVHLAVKLPLAFKILEEKVPVFGHLTLRRIVVFVIVVFSFVIAPFIFPRLLYRSFINIIKNKKN